MLRSIVATSLILAIALPASAREREHVVSAALRDARLRAQAGARGEDMAGVASLLKSEPAAKAARTLGIDLQRVSAGVSLLSDAELHDLAVRSAALQDDPVAGISSKHVVVILVLVAIIALVIYVASVANSLKDY